jgi:hypothetical protein
VCNFLRIGRDFKIELIAVNELICNDVGSVEFEMNYSSTNFFPAYFLRARQRSVSLQTGGYNFERATGHVGCEPN